MARVNRDVNSGLFLSCPSTILFLLAKALNIWMVEQRSSLSYEPLNVFPSIAIISPLDKRLTDCIIEQVEMLSKRDKVHRVLPQKEVYDYKVRSWSNFIFHRSKNVRELTL